MARTPTAASTAMAAVASRRDGSVTTTGQAMATPSRANTAPIATRVTAWWRCARRSCSRSSTSLWTEAGRGDDGGGEVDKDEDDTCAALLSTDQKGGVCG